MVKFGITWLDGDLKDEGYFDSDHKALDTAKLAKDVRARLKDVPLKSFLMDGMSFRSLLHISESSLKLSDARFLRAMSQNKDIQKTHLSG